MQNVINKMRIYDKDGNRLYLTVAERKRFLDVTKDESRENRMYCQILLNTGCRA